VAGGKGLGGVEGGSGGAAEHCTVQEGEHVGAGAEEEQTGAGAEAVQEAELEAELEVHDISN
jgi:hypothetical protein